MSTEITEALKAYFSEMGRKGGRASKGTQTAKLRSRAAGREAYFQRLFKMFLTLDDLVEELFREYPGAADRLETQGEMDRWLEAAFRIREDYQIRVKALLSPLPTKKTGAEADSFALRNGDNPYEEMESDHDQNGD